MSKLVQSPTHELPYESIDQTPHHSTTSLSGKAVLHQQYTDSNDTRKRKRESSRDSFRRIAILPCPYSHLDEPTYATPQFLIPRSRLNLSYIDSSPRSSSITRSRLFSAYIPLLEDPPDARTGDDEPSVLITRLDEDNDALYAIEQAKEGVYALCRLGAWVGEDQLKGLAKRGPGRRLAKASSSVANTASFPWWTGATVNGTTPTLSSSANRSKKETRGQSLKTTLRQDGTAQQTETAATLGITPAVQSIVGDGDSPGQQFAELPNTTPQDIYLSLIQQYLETLYLSGASLAYFAKGALSRARASCVAKQCTDGLVTCLRDLVMTVPATDKRYKEVLPTALKAHTVSDASPERDKKRAKRKGKALRRGKDGFLPGESEVLEKWWASDDSTISPSADFEHIVKSRLPRLRSRETLLQIVLILEALAIEKQVSDGFTSQTTGLGTTETAAESQITETPGVTDTQAKSKTKKTKDLQSLAETLVDRLTIWQSVETTDDRAKGQTGREDATTPALVENTDSVKDFCIDTVIPFYGSRLPELIDKLSEKMGVALASPVRPKPKSSDPFARLAPGTAIARDRPAPDRRKPMSRVSSDTSGKQARPTPSLIRSATESSLQEIKRERSSTTHSPFQDSRPPSRPLSRSGSIADGTVGKDKKRRSLSRANSISQPNKSLTQREVDFSAITKYNEAKARKKVNVENELKDAIATLKKPNREAAVKPVIEEAKARQNQTKAKPSLLAQRRSQLGTEVNATPKRVHKHRDTVMATPHRHPHVLEPESVPSSNPCIPASTLRPAPSASDLISGSSPMAAHTPIRAVKKASGPSAYPGLPPAFRSPAIFSTPQKPVTANTGTLVPTSSPPEADVPTTPSAAEIIAVPMSERGPLYPSKTKENRIMAPPLLQKAAKTTQPAGSQPVAETSIYDALGWDDDADGFM